MGMKTEFYLLKYWSFSCIFNSWASDLMFRQKFENYTFEFIETCSENGPVSVKLCHLSKLIGCNKRQEQSKSKVSGLNDHTVVLSGKGGFSYQVGKSGCSCAKW